MENSPIWVKVISKAYEADGICSFTLAGVDREPLPNFDAGAHVDVHIDAGVVRQYSLMRCVDQPGAYRIAVLLSKDSRGGSASMHHDIHVGSRLQISRPRNLFPLAPDARRSLLFGGGIGITPILSMAESLGAGDNEFELHYSARSAAAAPFCERLKASAFASQVHFYFDDCFGNSATGIVQALSRPASDIHIYVCGPTGYMDWIISMAIAAGWQTTQIHQEHFQPLDIPHAADNAFEVRIASTGHVYQVPSGRSVASVLLEEGIDVPLSCEQGMCGCCLTRVLEGIPDHRDVYMSAAEQSRNDMMAVCCSRAKSPLLVLDL